MIEKLIDIAFSGFWNFCGVFMLIAVIASLITEMFKSIFGSFKRDNIVNNYYNQGDKQ